MTAPHWRAGKSSHPLAMFSVWFLTVFLILFPKGGLKLGGLPLTWGYIYLGATAPLLLLIRLTQMPLRFPVRLIAALGFLLMFVLLYAYGGVAYGIGDMNITVSMFTGFVILPVAFLFIYPPFLAFVDGVRFSRYFRWSVLLAACWGLFLFFWRPFTGKFIEIPYLTVNIADYGQLETTKHIARGFYLKLISTYNNGNLYGIATLILLPLYQTLEKVRWRKGLVIVALMLTLARTVWAGLILAEALPLVVLLLRQFDTFPVVYLGKAVKQVAAIAITTGLVFVALLFNANANVSFLLDRTGGGRIGELAAFQSAGLVSMGALGPSQEIVYAAIVGNAGWLGLAAFISLMISPLLLLLVDRSALRSPVRLAAMQGLIIYAIISWVDGAIVLIPVMAFYWFVYMIFLFGWPNEAETLTAKAPKTSHLKWKRPRFRFGHSTPASSV